MTHQKLSIDWSLLERAFTDYSGTIYLLDTKMGRLISASPKADVAERQAMDRKRFHPHGRYVEIEPITEYEEAEDLSDYLEQGVAAEVLPLLSRLAWDSGGGPFAQAGCVGASGSFSRRLASAWIEPWGFKDSAW